MTLFFALIASFLVAGFLGRFLFKLLFKDADDLWDCVAAVFTPDIFSLFRGKLFEDMGKSLKVTAFVLGVGFSGFVTFGFVEGLGSKEDTEDGPNEETESEQPDDREP